MSSQFEKTLEIVNEFLVNRHNTLDQLPTRPTRSELDAALKSLPKSLPDHGLGTRESIQYLLDEIVPGLSTGHAGNRYFGLVTGGVTEGAQLADMVATSLDESLQLNFPDSTIGLALEDRTCDLVLDLLGIPPDTFAGRTITTGATASNIVGLACARDALLLDHPLVAKGWSIAEDGFPPTSLCPKGQPKPVMQIFCRRSHGSINKAAAVTGIGRRNVIDLAAPGEDILQVGMDLDELETKLRQSQAEGIARIVVVGLGEVNTGFFDQDIHRISDLCKATDSWLHIDAAFGAFGVLLPGNERLSAEMARADSLTVDAHKWLNCPYDCALLFTRHRESLIRSFGPSPKTAGPAYLAPSRIDPESGLDNQVQALRDWHSSLPSPLNCGIENSRRNRALPLFVALMEQGRDGYAAIVQRNCSFADAIAKWIRDADNGGRWYELVNDMSADDSTAKRAVPLNIVLFRGKPGTLYPPEVKDSANSLVKAINGTREIFVTITSWGGIGAVRIAVSNWRTARNTDLYPGELAAVLRILRGVMDPSSLVHDN